MNSEKCRTLRISDICTKIVSGGTPSTRNPDYYGGSIPWLKTQEVNFNRIYETETKITDAGLNNSSAKWIPANSVIMAMYGATAGKIAINKRPITTNQACCNLTINDKIADYRYVYYNLMSRFQEIASMAVGGAQQNLNADMIRGLEISLPPLSIQRRIADVLSNIDDKIELNRQTNATLEAIAQAIFKEWFVDFRYPGATGEMVDSELGPIPRGWRVGILSEVLSSIESGSRPKGGVGDLAEGIPSIGAENINELGFYDFSKEKFVSEEFFAKLKSGIVKSEDVLLYKDGASLGRKTMFMDGFPHQICAINEHVFILRSNNLINQLFLYFWLDQSYMTENIKSLNSNSAQPGINQPAVRSLPILIPEKTISEKFEQIVKPLLSKLFNDCKESYSLSLLRDKLLPKLMSGEIQI